MTITAAQDARAAQRQAQERSTVKAVRSLLRDPDVDHEAKLKLQYAQTRIDAGPRAEDDEANIDLMKKVRKDLLRRNQPSI